MYHDASKALDLLLIPLETISITIMLSIYTTIIMTITSYSELKLVTATTNAADEFLMTVPIPNTDFVFLEVPPRRSVVLKSKKS